MDLLADDITQLLRRSEAGDPGATSELLSHVYADLRQIARARLRGERGDTLGTTELVHEAWLAMARNEQASFGSRHHYFAYAAQAMRHILVDRARQRSAAKRQADAQEPATAAPGDDSLELLEIDQALTRLAALSPRLARVVELRLFMGLSSSEAGGLLGVTERTVERDWIKARALLGQWLGSPH